MSEFVDRIRVLAESIVRMLEAKGNHYGDSWRKRGGPGAFMVMARKWDRIENMAAAKGYDIFELCHTNEGDINDDIDDLIGYLLLIREYTGPCKELSPGA